LSFAGGLGRYVEFNRVGVETGFWARETGSQGSLFSYPALFSSSTSYYLKLYFCLAFNCFFCSLPCNLTVWTQETCLLRPLLCSRCLKYFLAHCGYLVHT
jgi:hypothetical protein